MPPPPSPFPPPPPHPARDEVYSDLAVNNGPNCLHGGARGFDRRMWSAAPFARGSGADAEAGVALTLRSPDGEEGFPGELLARATYSVSAAALTIAFEATASGGAPTVCNLANHAYWNLGGPGIAEADADAPSRAAARGARCGGATIATHRLRLGASRYTPVDPATMIPTGELLPVAGSPFDFTAPGGVPLGERLQVPRRALFRLAPLFPRALFSARAVVDATAAMDRRRDRASRSCGRRSVSTAAASPASTTTLWLTARAAPSPRPRPRPTPSRLWRRTRSRSSPRLEMTLLIWIGRLDH